MQIPTLTPTQRRNLRSHAHHLHPLVVIGNAGLTPAVIAAVDLELAHHELIKVRAFSDDRGEREALLEAICKACGCAAVQHIGKLLIVYRAALDGAQIDPNTGYGQALAAKTRKVIEPVGAQLTKKQAASGKKRDTATIKKLDKHAVKKLIDAPRRSTRRDDAEAPAQRAAKYNAIPGNSSARRTHLSAAERRAAYATVTERAPRPTTKPARTPKAPRRAGSGNSYAATPRKAPARKR